MSSTCTGILTVGVPYVWTDTCVKLITVKKECAKPGEAVQLVTVARRGVKSVTAKKRSVSATEYCEVNMNV